ncbi:MAG: hypothetical protein IJY25_03845 [Bacilli bacterium]|nr:hypothetical protein [Bacilli bacterium]
MFSKEVYKKQNGSLFVILSLITSLLFLLLIVIIVMPGQITYPTFLEKFADFLSMFIGCLCVVGFVGFPLSLCLYKGMKNLYVNSKLGIDDNKVYYIQQTEAVWTIFGRSTEYKTYNVIDIKSFNISKRWIKIYGNIEKETIYNKRKSGKENVEVVKIARAFDTDEKIINFLNKNK